METFNGQSVARNIAQTGRVSADARSREHQAVHLIDQVRDIASAHLVSLLSDRR